MLESVTAPTLLSVLPFFFGVIVVPLASSRSTSFVRKPEPVDPNHVVDPATVLNIRASP
jgi:hypothetical protein